jgi:hypothetical protein
MCQAGAHPNRIDTYTSNLEYYVIWSVDAEFSISMAVYLG